MTERPVRYWPPRQAAAPARPQAAPAAAVARTPSTGRRQPFGLPFYYGWAIVACAFATMAVGVNARTAFSLLYPAILEEFGWQRGETAGAFAMGFVFAAILGPISGLMLNRFGPRLVMPLGSVMMAGGFVSTTFISAPWMLYPSFGLLVIGGSTILGYIGHAATLPLWFQRRRGLAVGIAFAGVGVGAVTLLPFAAYTIEAQGWRDACWIIAAIVFCMLAPLNLIVQRRRPSDIGLQPDGAPQATDASGAPAPAAEGPTLGMALRTPSFWFFAVAAFGMLWCWYAVQVHQTQYLLDLSYDIDTATFALAMVSALGVLGQINGGWLADRIGRESAWTIGSLGFVACYACLFAMAEFDHPALLWAMVIAQGLIGYGLTAVFASAPADMFQGQHYSTIFGALSVASSLGGGAGPYFTGLLYDLEGGYQTAFLVAIGWALFSIAAMWLAAPRRARIHYASPASSSSGTTS